MSLVWMKNCRVLRAKQGATRSNEQARGYGFALSCIPGRLVYVKSEDEELLLQR